MRNLNNYDEFMAFIAEALEPFAEICADPDIAAAFRSGGKAVGVASMICRKYPDQIAAVLAATDGISVYDFKEAFNPLSLFGRVSDLLNSDVAKQLFASAQQTEGASRSGNVQADTAV